MKKFKRLFQEAERLSPPPGLWRHIEARVGMKPVAAARGGGFWESPALRLAASVVLAVGLLGLGVSLRKRTGRTAAHASGAAASASPSAQAAGQVATEDTELVDPELLGWHADLGEMDDEADEAEEVL